MIALHIFMDAEGMMQGVDRSKIVEAEKDISIGVLSSGMKSGQPSVSFSFELPDSSVVFAETSYALFMACAKAFAARYGWPNDGPVN